MSEMEKIRRQASRDAKRYSEAQMNYGKGAGTRRKLLKAEIDEKMKDYHYEVEFHKALSRINQGDILKKVETKKGIQKTYNGAKKAVRTARRASNFYSRNKSWIDDLLRLIFGE